MFVDWVYYSKNPLVKGLFWKRINTAISLGQINDTSLVLDIGCHPGHLLRSVRQLNRQCECIGIDLEPEVNKLQVSNCIFQVADSKDLPFSDDYFSIVFALDTLEHIREADIAIREIRRVLRKDGFAILSGPTESWFYRFCRFLQFRQYKKNVPYNPGFARTETDYHFHNVYELERIFVKHGFRLLERKALPGNPLPELFRLSKFQRKNF